MKRFIFILLFLFSFTNFLASQERFVGDGLFQIFGNSVQKRIGKSHFEIESINTYNRNQKRITKTNALKLDSVINYDVNNKATYKNAFFYNNLGQTTKSIRYRSTSHDSLGISAFAIQHFQYDSNGYCTNVRFQIVNKPNRRGVVTLDFKYNTNGLLISRITKSRWDTTDWENISKITVSYTDSKQILQTTNYNWEDSVWAPIMRLEFSYDSVDNNTHVLYLHYKDRWIVRGSYYDLYNFNNKIIYSYACMPSKDSIGNCDTAYKRHYYYDSNNNLVREEKYSTSSAQGTKHQYIYDTLGNLISKETYYSQSKYGEWKISSRYKYSYDGFNNRTEELLYHIKTENGKEDKDLEDKTQFVVDATQNSDSTIVFPFLFFGPKGSPYLMKKEFYSWEQNGEWNKPNIEKFFYSMLSPKD